MQVPQVPPRRSSRLHVRTGGGPGGSTRRLEHGGCRHSGQHDLERLVFIGLLHERGGKALDVERFPAIALQRPQNRVQHHLGTADVVAGIGSTDGQHLPEVRQALLVVAAQLVPLSEVEGPRWPSKAAKARSRT